MTATSESELEPCNSAVANVASDIEAANTRDCSLMR